MFCRSDRWRRASAHQTMSDLGWRPHWIRPDFHGAADRHEICLQKKQSRYLKYRLPARVRYKRENHNVSGRFRANDHFLLAVEPDSVVIIDGGVCLVASNHEGRQKYRALHDNAPKRPCASVAGVLKKCPTAGLGIGRSLPAAAARRAPVPFLRISQSGSLTIAKARPIPWFVECRSLARTKGHFWAWRGRQPTQRRCEACIASVNLDKHCLRTKTAHMGACSFGRDDTQLPRAVRWIC